MEYANQRLQKPAVRLAYIDALRGMAALLVLFCHSLQIDNDLVLPQAISQSLAAGKYGVQLFFVISALTIFYSLERGDSNTINFFIRRFFRIAPLYFFAVATYALMYANTDVTGIGLNLFFLHGFSPEYINSVVPGGWSIGVEMVFYCMIPFLFKRVSNLKRALYFFSGSLILSFIVMYLYRQVITPSSELESFIYFWLPNQLPVFALGFVVYFLVFSQAPFTIKTVYYPLVVWCLIVLISVITKLPILADHVVFAIACATLVFLCSKQSFPGLSNKVTLFLGKISYSLYLSQYAAIFILQKSGMYSLLPGKTTSGSIVNIAINIALLLVVTCTLSTILFHLIELPFQKLGKRFLIRKTEQVVIKQPVVKIYRPGEKGSGVKTN